MAILEDWSDFFDASDFYTGPPLTEALVDSAERTLGFALPGSYLRLLRVKNGGQPRRGCFPTDERWDDDHVRISTLFGVGYAWGIDSDQFGSRHLIRQAGFPEIGIVVALTPTAGHDAIMLDYSACGPQGEPRVVYVDPEDDRCDILAPDFASFLGGLVDCRPYDEARDRQIEEFRRRSRPG
ncbi:MAG: SMI1/KNR4 family protein [Isosphaeraceae bacterium]